MRKMNWRHTLDGARTWGSAGLEAIFRIVRDSWGQLGTRMVNIIGQLELSKIINSRNLYNWSLVHSNFIGPFSLLPQVQGFFRRIRLTLRRLLMAKMPADWRPKLAKSESAECPKWQNSFVGFFRFHLNKSVQNYNFATRKDTVDLQKQRLLSE
jgi:hypothetical protein